MLRLDQSLGVRMGISSAVNKLTLMSTVLKIGAERLILPVVSDFKVGFYKIVRVEKDSGNDRRERTRMATCSPKPTAI